MCVESIPTQYTNLLANQYYSKLTSIELVDKVQSLENQLKTSQNRFESQYNEEDQLRIESLLAYYDNLYNGKDINFYINMKWNQM